MRLIKAPYLNIGANRRFYENVTDFVDPNIGDRSEHLVDRRAKRTLVYLWLSGMSETSGRIKHVFVTKYRIKVVILLRLTISLD